ncbi:MAG: four helix bundle protein [Gemmatimonas sp.]
MFDHEQLQIWQRSHALAVSIHFALKGRARTGSPGLYSQLLRSSSSVPANIAEAAGQDSPSQSVRFLDIAIGSLSETQNHLALASATGLLQKAKCEELSEEARNIRRMSLGFRRWLESRASPS